MSKVAARARIEDGNIPEEMSHEITRATFIAIEPLLSKSPRGQIIPARTTRGFRIWREYSNAGPHEIIPILDRLWISSTYDKNNCRKIGCGFVRQTCLPIGRDAAGALCNRINIGGKR